MLGAEPSGSRRGRSNAHTSPPPTAEPTWLREREDLGAVSVTPMRVLDVGGRRAVGGHTVQPSSSSRVSVRPAFTIGSTANTMPGRSFMPLPGGP